LKLICYDFEIWKLTRESSVIFGTVLIEHRSKVTRTQDGGELVLASVFSRSWSLIKLIMNLAKLELIRY